jgi:hypothetical protein
MSKKFTRYLVCEVAPGGKKHDLVTARGRLSYPHLFKPSAGMGDGGGEGALRYSTTLLFPDNADISLLQETCYLIAAEKWGAKWREKFPKLPMPWKNSTDENQNGIPHYKVIGIDPKEFPVFIRTGSLADFGPPKVVEPDPRVRVGSDRADEVYAGRWARLTVQPYAYERPSKKGVSLGLQNVQLLENDEPLGSMRRAAEQEFSPVELEESADSFFA